MNEFDALWVIFEPILRVYNTRPNKAGRPRKEDRPIFNGVMWLTRSGARWKDLPAEYGSYQTAHRRYQEWIKAGLIDRLYENTMSLAMERGHFDLREGFIDATFAPAKKGGHDRPDEKGKRQQNHGHLRRKRPVDRTVARKRQST